MVPIADDAARRISCSIVRCVIPRNQLPRSVPQPWTIKPANDFALTISQESITHIFAFQFSGRTGLLTKSSFKTRTIKIASVAAAPQPFKGNEFESESS